MNYIYSTTKTLYTYSNNELLLLTPLFLEVLIPKVDKNRWQVLLSLLDQELLLHILPTHVIKLLAFYTYSSHCF